ncbi:MAG: chemotaxis protein CheW [Deltaproteobacteria bacterium]|nr:chemotaxis protein CheW [Deltaproteobacteria bacterium]
MDHQEQCWKRIGVWGPEKPSCPELERVIHCRNCEVFTQAGRNLLERDLPEDYKDEWGQVLLAKKEEIPVGTIPVVIFRVEGEWLALPAQLFAEIIETRTVHTVPHRKSDVLLGVINVHGEIQLCVSIKTLLGLAESEAHSDGGRKQHNRLMVMNKDGDQWVFPVDEIHGVQHVHPNMFQAVPVTVSKSKSSFTRKIFKWKDNPVALLDDELLFYSLKRRIQ